MHDAITNTHQLKWDAIKLLIILIKVSTVFVNAHTSEICMWHSYTAWYPGTMQSKCSSWSSQLNKLFWLFIFVFLSRSYTDHPLCFINKHLQQINKQVNKQTNKHPTKNKQTWGNLTQIELPACHIRSIQRPAITADWSPLALMKYLFRE